MNLNILVNRFFFFWILSVWINMIEWMNSLLNKTCNFRLLFSVNFAKMKSRYLMSLFIKCNDHYLWEKRGNPVDFNKDYKYNFWYYIIKSLFSQLLIFTSLVDVFMHISHWYRYIIKRLCICITFHVFTQNNSI